MDARSQRARRSLVLATTGMLLLGVGSVRAADPPPILLQVTVDPNFQVRYIARQNDWAGFESELSQTVATRLVDNAYWSIFCWPLTSGAAAAAGGELHIQLKMRVDRKNWLLNVQFVSDGRPDLIGEFRLFDEGVIGSRIGQGTHTFTGPGSDVLGDYLVAWMWEHVLNPQSPLREKAHMLFRNSIPIGTGEVAPLTLTLDPDCGVVLTDHPILARTQRRFRFLPKTPAAQPLRTVGTGATIPFQVGAEIVPCIVVRFEQAPPPAPGTQGAVFLAEFADPSADDALLFP